jgi:PAS domain S-box-containing protein
MRLYSRVAAVRRLRGWPTLGGPATIALAIVLFVGVFALREGDANVGDAEGTLYVVPIAVLALRFGLRGGLAGSALSSVLTVTWGLSSHHVAVTLGGYLSRGVAFVVLGVLLGTVVDKLRRLAAETSRYYEVSPDLFATADQTGRCIRVSPAWERTLGHSAETMRSRPLMDFVHPDDREASIAELARLAAGGRDTLMFRARLRTIDGSYRWMQWSASASDGLIHAVGRDISAQHEAEQVLANNATWLEAKVVERTRELDEARAETLQRLAIAAEYHDDETAQHTRRVGASAAEIAVSLGLGAEQVSLIRDAAPLHDVGKLAITDTILLKRGGLTAPEYDVMKTHAALGARVLSGSHAPVLVMAAIIAASHHEHWDGTGYPLGLAGEAIPLVGRIVAVADVFDALTQARPYKPAWPLDNALAEIKHSAGSQFDPRVVAAFLATHQQTMSPSGAATRKNTSTPLMPRGKAAAALPLSVS